MFHLHGYFIIRKEFIACVLIEVRGYGRIFTFQLSGGAQHLLGHFQHLRFSIIIRRSFRSPSEGPRKYNQIIGP